jgi:hypothetical protein
MGSERKPASHLSLVSVGIQEQRGTHQQDRSLAIVIDCSTEASGCLTHRSDCFSKK